MAKLLIVFLFTLSINAFAQVTTTTVYTTTNGTKYHKINCKYLTKSKIETTLAKAKEAKYEACKVCKPDTTITSTTVTTTNTTTTTQCTAITQKGTQCKHKVELGRTKCWQH